MVGSLSLFILIIRIKYYINIKYLIINKLKWGYRLIKIYLNTGNNILIFTFKIYYNTILFSFFIVDKVREYISIYKDLLKKYLKKYRNI